MLAGSASFPFSFFGGGGPLRGSLMWENRLAKWRCCFCARGALRGVNSDTRVWESSFWHVKLLSLLFWGASDRASDVEEYPCEMWKNSKHGKWTRGSCVVGCVARGDKKQEHKEKGISRFKGNRTRKQGKQRHKPTKVCKGIYSLKHKAQKKGKTNNNKK